jgi:UDP-N-acetylmuramoyl-L-alanyl-D-glutamate--2,6-diaminopimelate ligase
MDIEVRGVTLDSREVADGFVFVAVRGTNVDAHRFLDDAVKRGARAIVSEEAPARSDVTWIQTPDSRWAAGALAAGLCGHPSSKLRVVGVTGTNGKTTSSYLVSSALSRLAPPTAMMGTVEARIGEERFPTRHTTPEAPVVQSFLLCAYEAGARFGVLEVSSHGLSLSRLAGTEFDVALFTNLSRDHLDYHEDMESYFQAKRALFTRYLRETGRAVVCIDDAYGERLAAELQSRAVTYGASDSADLNVASVEADMEGLRIRFREQGVERELTSRLLGGFNARNLIGAYGVVRALGFEPEETIGALEDADGAPGRFERVPLPSQLGFDVVVDYAHTDDALRKVLEAARPLTRNRLTVVFGAGGERDRDKRPLMGDVASRLADGVVVTSDNPRGEDPLGIIKEIQLGVGGAPVDVEPDRRAAIELAMSRAEPGDLVVVAGKGHETYQVISGRVLPFDDREVVRDIARKMTDSGGRR